MKTKAQLATESMNEFASSLGWSVSTGTPVFHHHHDDLLYGICYRRDDNEITLWWSGVGLYEALVKVAGGVRSVGGCSTSTKLGNVKRFLSSPGEDVF